MENDAFDMFNTSGTPDAITVTKRQEHKATSQKEQMVHQLIVEVEKNRSGNGGVLKAASGNMAKRAKMKKT